MPKRFQFYFQLGFPAQKSFLNPSQQIYRLIEKQICIRNLRFHQKSDTNLILEAEIKSGSEDGFPVKSAADN